MSRIAVLCGTGMNALVDALPDSLTMIGRESLRIDSPWGEVPTELIQFSVQERITHEIAIIQRHQIGRASCRERV